MFLSLHCAWNRVSWASPSPRAPCLFSNLCRTLRRTLGSRGSSALRDLQAFLTLFVLSLTFLSINCQLYWLMFLVLHLWSPWFPNTVLFHGIPCAMSAAVKCISDDYQIYLKCQILMCLKGILPPWETPLFSVFTQLPQHVKHACLWQVQDPFLTLWGRHVWLDPSLTLSMCF